MHDSREYLEVSFFFTPFTEEWAEIIEAEISELPFDSFLISEEKGLEPCLKGYIPKDLYDSRALKVLLSGLEIDVKFRSDLVPPQNWNLEWEKQFTPIVIGKDVLVRSIYHDKDDIALARIAEGLKAGRSRYNIVLDPAMAFGTGHHSTTRLVIRQMLSRREDIAGKNVLDMGCGTGVLAILAAKMGSSKVLAIDIDAVAAQSAFDNARLNRISKKIDARYGDASLLQALTYDTILANIHRNVIVQDMPTYLRSLRKGGLMILSGFYEGDVMDIEKAYEGAAETLIQSVSEKDPSGRWACLVARKNR